MIFNNMRDKIKKCLMEYQEQKETDIFSVIEKDVAHFVVEIKLKYNLESIYQAADIASQILEQSGWETHIPDIKRKSLLDLGDGQLNEDN